MWGKKSPLVYKLKRIPTYQANKWKDPRRLFEKKKKKEIYIYGLKIEKKKHTYRAVFEK